MLAEGAVRLLQRLRHDPHARRVLNYVPLGGICWSDEWPDSEELRALPKAEHAQVLRLFSIRFRLWDGEPLTPADRRFWDDARAQVPEWPVFRRLELAPEDRAAQEQVTREILAFFGEADELEVGDSGHVTATFKLD